MIQNFSKKQVKKKKAKKLSITKVQDAVNYAIRKRDVYCINQDGTCSGRLEASHFFGKGGNGGIRFHPDNIHGQCTKHHFDHHQRNPLVYVEWMQREKPDELELLESMRGKAIKYSQVTLQEIYDRAKVDDLDGIRELIEALHGL